MSWLGDLSITIAGGVVVPIILGGVGILWHKGRIPTMLSRSVRRSRYLSTVLKESVRESVDTLDVLAPRLEPARDNELLRRIQHAWKDIENRGKVRVLTLDNPDCLEGGAELLSDGIDVRVAQPVLGSGSLSFHMFGSSRRATVTTIVNHREHAADQPVRLVGAVPAQVFRGHFEGLWERARSLESVIASRIMANADSDDPAEVLRSLELARAGLRLEGPSIRRILPHLAFQHGCQVIFIVGLPGAGKSFIRRRLTDQLQELGLANGSLTDYVYAYRDHLHSLLKLHGTRGTGFKAVEGGAFAVRDEGVLAPALRALAGAVRDVAPSNEVTLVEFARTDLVTALREFDGTGLRSQVIHVAAPSAVREVRLRRRAEPPVSQIGSESISLRLSDDHLLPSTAERALYGLDGLPTLKQSASWRSRMFEMDNSVDDDGGQVDRQLDEFIDRMLRPYRLEPARVV